MDWALLAIWLIGMPGAYSVTRPIDGTFMRWFETLLWPIVLNGAVIVLAFVEAAKWIEGRDR